MSNSKTTSGPRRVASHPSLHKVNEELEEASPDYPRGSGVMVRPPGDIQTVTSIHHRSEEVIYAPSPRPGFCHVAKRVTRSENPDSEDVDVDVDVDSPDAKRQKLSGAVSFCHILYRI